jgi:DNA-binding NtrC family response regulator
MVQYPIPFMGRDRRDAMQAMGQVGGKIETTEENEAIDILLVDDEADVADDTLLILQHAFPYASIRWASTLEEAQRLIGRASIVLLDGHINGKTSDQLVGAMKTLPYTIVISSDRSLAKRLRALGCQELLPKPFEGDALIKLVGKRLRLH